jgi:hypothetical protein
MGFAPAGYFDISFLIDLEVEHKKKADQQERERGRLRGQGIQGLVAGMIVQESQGVGRLGIQILFLPQIKNSVYLEALE